MECRSCCARIDGAPLLLHAWVVRPQHVAVASHGGLHCSLLARIAAGCSRSLCTLPAPYYRPARRGCFAEQSPRVRSPAQVRKNQAQARAVESKVSLRRDPFRTPLSPQPEAVKGNVATASVANERQRKAEKTTQSCNIIARRKAEKYKLVGVGRWRLAVRRAGQIRNHSHAPRPDPTPRCAAPA